MYWELREDKQVNTFTCTGLAAEDTVRWVLQDATLQYIILGSCPPRLMGGEVVCDSQFSYAPPSRISDNTSEITIDTSRISPSILNGRGRLICSVLNVPGAEGSCRVDYICKMKISMVIFFLTNSTSYTLQENICLTSPIVTYFKHRAKINLYKRLQVKSLSQLLFLLTVFPDPGENISCSAQVNNYTQTVFGQCTVGKIRSSQNRYRCEWIQTREVII